MPRALRRARVLLVAVLLCGSMATVGCTFSIGFDSDPIDETLEITQQPQSVIVSAGQQATFVVGATGGRLTFQWHRNGLAIAGAGGSAYTTPPTIRTDDSTLFTVRVCNELACVTSSPALLSVLPAP